MNEDKATRYRRLRRRAGVLMVCLWAALLVWWLVSGLSHALAHIAMGLTTRDGAADVIPSASVAVYALVLALLGSAVVFPVTCHTEYILERRFGLSRRRLLDWLRGYTHTTVAQVIAWTIGAMLVYETIRRWPEWWWIIAGFVFGMLTLVTTHVAPLVTWPWLYRLRPLRRPELKRRLEALVRRVGVPVAAIHEWQLGSETPRPNAVLVGIGSTLRVLLSDTLLTDYNDDEIEVVLAHELAHHVHHDVWTTLLFETATAMVACGAAHWALHRVGPLVGLAGATDMAGLPLVILAGGAVVLMLTPVANLMSRQHERRADEYALTVTGNPEALASGLRRLAVQALAEERPSRVVTWLFYAHPPLAARLGAARAAMVGPQQESRRGATASRARGFSGLWASAVGIGRRPARRGI